MADDEGYDRGMEDATAEEKQPINSVERGDYPEDGTTKGATRDGDVIIRKKRGPNAPGCIMTKCQACMLFFFVLVLIGITGLCTYFLATPKCKEEPKYGFLSSYSKPKPTVQPGLAWSNIRLPNNLVPSFYNLVLKVDVDKFTFEGSVDITIQMKDSFEYVIVHVNALDITASRVLVRDLGTNEEVEIMEQIPVKPNQFYVLHMANPLEQGKRYLIRFGEFKGTLQDDLRGLYRSSYKDQRGNMRYLAASQLQSIDARKVFPCFDEPDLKANFSVVIVHKQEFTALSNMPVEETTRMADGWIRDKFKTTPVMSTYLLAFVIADFRFRELSGENGPLVRIWSQPDTYEQTQYALQFAGKAYDFFAEYFNTPEVVPKADHVAIPDFSAGAMENWGLVLYRETALLHDELKSSISNKYWVSLVMAHEIAHTWFGNMVTMKWWDDLWLNEGFANTLMYFALDDIHSNWKVFDLQLVNNIYPVMTKDSLLTSHAISTPINDPDDIPQFFDSISYDKGMAVLRLLRGFLGWDEFQKGLQMYISRYKFKNAKMSELWQTFKEAVGGEHDVGLIMDTWTRQMGFPVVTVRHIGGNKYKLNQERFLLNPEDKKGLDRSKSRFKYKWRIPFSYRLENSEQVRTKWMNMKSAEITIPGDMWIIGNVNYMGFYRTNYDDSMWNKLVKQLKTHHKIFLPANRAGLISDAFNLARANKLNYEIALNLSSYLSNEDDFVPWRAFLDSIDFIKGMLSTSNAYGKLLKYIRDLVAPQYRRVGTSDQGDLLDRNLRQAVLEAATSVLVPDAVEWARNMFDSWMKYGTRIPPDYAVVVYSVGVAQGSEKEWNHVWEKSKTTNVASEAEIMMHALAFSQEPWLLWRYARWSMDSEKIRMQDVRNLFRYFASTPLGRSVALQFLLTNWIEINERFGMDAFLLRDIIYATTSLINTEYEYKQLERLYKDHPPAGVARKAAENSLALISSNIEWMKSNQDTIENWLLMHIPEDKFEDKRS